MKRISPWRPERSRPNQKPALPARYKRSPVREIRFTASVDEGADLYRGVNRQTTMNLRATRRAHRAAPKFISAWAATGLRGGSAA
jgi:hypothetical protein